MGYCTTPFYYYVQTNTLKNVLITLKFPAPWSTKCVACKTCKQYKGRDFKIVGGEHNTL